MARNINIKIRAFTRNKVTHVLLTIKKTSKIAKIKNEYFLLLIIRINGATNKKRTITKPITPAVIQNCKKELCTLL